MYDNTHVVITQVDIEGEDNKCLSGICCTKLVDDVVCSAYVILIIEGTICLLTIERIYLHFIVSSFFN